MATSTSADFKQNNPHWPYRRLSDDCIRAILLSQAHPKLVSAQLHRNYGIKCSPSMIWKIRAGTRRTDISRVGTPWEHYQPKRKIKKWAKRPEYARKYSKRPKLKRGYYLRPIPSTLEQEIAS